MYFCKGIYVKDVEDLNIVEFRTEAKSDKPSIIIIIIIRTEAKEHTTTTTTTTTTTVLCANTVSRSYEYISEYRI